MTGTPGTPGPAVPSARAPAPSIPPPAIPPPASPVPASPVPANTVPANTAPVSPVTQVALEFPPRTAAGHVVEMLTIAARAPSEPERLAAAVNAAALIQAAAEHRDPAGLAAFARALSRAGAAIAAACALDLAAASRDPADLARLAATLSETDHPSSAPAAAPPADHQGQAAPDQQEQEQDQEQEQEQDQDQEQDQEQEQEQDQELAQGQQQERDQPEQEAPDPPDPPDPPGQPAPATTAPPGTEPGRRIPDLPGLLLAAVARRRVPRDVAAVLRALDGILAERLLAALAAARSVPDAGYVMLGLRAAGEDFLARMLADAMAAQPDPAAAAGFARDLWDHGDRANASYVVGAVLGRDVRHVAGFVAAMLAADGPLASSVLGEAARLLAPADRIGLATLLLAELPPGAGDQLWAQCTDGLTGGTIVAAFTALKQQAGPAGLRDELAAAATALRVDLVADLARSAHRWPDDGGAAAVFRPVARLRPVAEITELARCLLASSDRDLAWELLDLAAQEVPGRDGITDAAQLIIALTRHDQAECRHRFRRDPWRWRDRIPGIIDGVAARRRPALVMGLIDCLVEDHYYDEYARAIKTAVARDFKAAELAGLPAAAAAAGVRPHLRVVLQIIRQAVVNPESVPPRSVPGLVLALRAAGAAPEQLAGLLRSIGSHPYLDGRAIVDAIAALEQAGLAADAEIVRAARCR